MKENICEAGHRQHKTKLVPTRNGSMYVYDTSKYPDEIEGYCNGKDDISRTLISKGSWEDFETTQVVELLTRNRDYNELQMVLDLGSHIGWYSILAANMGYTVVAFDADIENLNLVRKTANLQLVGNRIETRHIWIDGNTEKFRLPTGMREVELVKIDLEGNEGHGISMIEDGLISRYIKHVFIELSPTFNQDSARILAKMAAYDFTAYIYEQGGWRQLLSTDEFEQINILFKRNDLP